MSQLTTQANATTTVRVYEQVAYDEPAEGPALSRIHLGELFSGDIEACGITEFLQATHTDGSASFAGIERVNGALGARRGTFLIQSTGSLSGKAVSAEWRVIPGSGTGELEGLRGTGSLRSKLGEGGTVRLDYWYE